MFITVGMLSHAKALELVTFRSTKLGTVPWFLGPGEVCSRLAPRQGFRRLRFVPAVVTAYLANMLAFSHRGTRWGSLR